MDVDDDARTIGVRLRQLRKSRRKSLVVVAGLAKVLQIAPSELTAVPVPGDGQAGVAVAAVRAALLAVGHQQPGGQVLAVEALRARVLIRDLRSSIAAGRDVAELSALAVVLHSGATLGWLRLVSAPLDLRSQVAMLARNVAQDHGTPAVQGLAVWGGLYVLATAGAFDLVLAEVDSVRVVAGAHSVGDRRLRACGRHRTGCPVQAGRGGPGTARDGLPGGSARLDPRSRPHASSVNCGYTRSI